jgi:RES domain-containing protein
MPTPHLEFQKWFSQLNSPGVVPRIGWRGSGFRAVEPKWMSRPYRLTGVGAVNTGGRWNVKQLVPALNFGTTPEVTFAEANYKFIAAGLPAGSFTPQTWVEFELILQEMIDLTDGSILATLGLTQAALTSCDWEGAQIAGLEPLTQGVSRAAFETMAEGLIVPSARLAAGINIIVFPSHIKAGSAVKALKDDKILFAHGL